MRRNLSGGIRAFTASATASSMQSNKPVRLVLDFDGTLTRKDTLSLLAWAGYSSKNNNASSETWSKVSKAYMTNIEKHTEDYRPKKADRRTIPEELTWLASLDEAEKASFNRVQKSGIFSSVERSEIDATAGQLISNGDVSFRPGWIDLFSKVNGLSTISSDLPLLEILSVSFSRQWLESCIKNAAAMQGHAAEFDATFKPKLRVHANEICDFGFNEPNNIQTSKDKVRVLSEAILCSAQEDASNSRGLLIYVGDSTTDLGCLIAADLGCCILDDSPSSGQKELQETLNRVGVAVDDLTNFSHEDLHALNGTCRERINIHGLLDAALPSKLWRIRDFNEVEHWLSSWWPTITA